MIYDCFTYFNEVDVLKIRMNEMDSTNCTFVVVEANETFTGEPKPYHFDELPDWIDQWRDRIIRVQTPFDTVDANPWKRERIQRNAILAGLELCEPDPDDVIIISDVDEVPRASVVGNYGEPVQLDVLQYFWKLNWQVPQHCNQGARPVMCAYKDLDKTPQEMRASTMRRIPYGGWHFSFLNSVENTQKKIEAFAHQEYNEVEYKERAKVLERIRDGIDPFDRFPLKHVDIDHSYPMWVLNNQRELKDLIVQP
jgi:beta-1,4-mannosyl-glycoprotein beta-1,4-N-acetylglucosaminyltransferase